MTDKVYVQIDYEKREATEAELVQLQLDRATWEAVELERLAAEEGKRKAKESANAKLAALGLTPEEISALIA